MDTLRLKTTNTEKLRIATFGNQKQEVQAVNLVELALSKSETGFKLPLHGFSVPHIWSELQGQDLSWVKENYPRSSMAARKGGRNQLKVVQVAVSTTVAWVLSDPVKNFPKERLSSIQFSPTHVLRVDSGSNDTLHEDFEKLWELDSIGIREKDLVHTAFERNVSFKDGK